jgi:DNA helicase II / ATP-dependent DNA helicase PcrA
MKTIDFEGDLNAEQYAAASAGEGPMLILAAAGTGKTRTLVYRVAFLVSQGIDPERLLLLTFTNRAAKEMLERADELVGHPAGIPWSGTFHHIANRILRRHAPLLDYRNNYTIMDRDDSRSLMTTCIKELKLQSKEFPKKDVLLHVLGMATNSEMALGDKIADHFRDHDVDQHAVLAVLKLYIAKKRELDAMDFDDMLVNCLKLLREHPQVRDRYATQFQYVLVDEYQDTNRIQAELVDLLAGHHKNLFVVGDDFQSIYSWRGADYRNIIDFKLRYPAAKIYKLETNYRSVPEVLALANATVGASGHPEEFRKTLRATREAYRNPTVARLRDGEHQARFVVDQIQNFTRDGYRPSDIVVLYRAHYHAMELQMAMTRGHVPHVITSGMRFFEQAHVKDMLCLLRVLSCPEDALAFNRLLCLLPGVGAMTAQKLWKKLGGRFDSDDPDARQLLLTSLRKGAQVRWEKVDPILAAYHDEDLSHDGGDVIQRFVDAFYDTYAADTFENFDSRIDDIRELMLHTAKFESVEQCLSDVALLTNLDAEAENLSPDQRNAVRLSTVHQAKGLEWPVVIMIWVTEGMFPSPRTVNESDEGEAEERRLFYVAATRAKDELVLCTPEVRRMRDGGVMYCQPSRFIDELPEEVISSRRIGFI